MQIIQGLLITFKINIMKNKTLFHGTTLDNYNKIIASNFGNKETYSWNVSDDNCMYFYDLDKTDQDEKEYKKDECINKAFESAQLTASIENVICSALVVLELKIPVNLCDDDYSCENMANEATCVDLENIDLHMIKKIHVCENGYIPSLRLLYCAGLLKQNNYIKKDNFSHIELGVIKNIDFGFYDELHLFEYTTEVKEFNRITA